MLSLPKKKTVADKVLAVPLREGEGGHVVRIDLHVGGTCRTSIGGLSFLFSPNLTYLEQRKLGFYQTHKVISSSMNSSLALP